MEQLLGLIVLSFQCNDEYINKEVDSKEQETKNEYEAVEGCREYTAVRQKAQAINICTSIPCQHLDGVNGCVLGMQMRKCLRLGKCLRNGEWGRTCLRPRGI